MTTGRINQVATSRLKAGHARTRRPRAYQHEVRKCVWTFFDCVLASVSQLSCTTAPPQRLRPQVETPWRGAAGKTGSAAPALWNSIPPRSSAEVCYWMRVTIEWMVAKQPLIHTTPKKSTGHPGSDSLALHVKAKKEKRIKDSLIKHLLDVTQKREEPATGGVAQREERIKKK